MKRVVQIKKLYICSKCRTQYSSKKNASRCEKRIREEKFFCVGDMVQNIEPRTCQLKNKNYIFSGKIIKILGPIPSDYEYEAKWLGGKSERLNAHVFVYQVKFLCPHCKKTKETRYYTPELKYIDRR